MAQRLIDRLEQLSCALDVVHSLIVLAHAEIGPGTISKDGINAFSAAERLLSFADADAQAIIRDLPETPQEGR